MPMSARALNIAHRGGAGLWPENTLQAFAHAIALPVHGIEFDLQLTADNQLAIHHDARLKPDATRKNGIYLKPPTPKISDLTMAELAAYDVGRLDPKSPYSQRRRAQTPIDGATIPGFDALCALVHDTAPSGFRLYAELKTEMGDMNDGAHAATVLADCFVEAISGSGLLDQTTVISFDWRCLARVCKALPNIANAYTTAPFALTNPDHASAAHDLAGSEEARMRAASKQGAPWWGEHDWRAQAGDTHGEKVLHAIAAAGGDGWFAYQRDIDATTLALAETLGLGVSAWTVNEAANMRALDQQGVAALVTDRPDILKQL